MSKKILIVNDSAQLTGCNNYVVNTIEHLESRGYEVKHVRPTDKGFISFKTNLIGNLHWAIVPKFKLLRDILQFKPEYILIATVEASLGKATKDICKFLKFFGFAKSIPYTLSYTTDIKKYYQNLFKKSLISKAIGKKLSEIVISLIGKSQDLYTRIYYSGAYRVMVNAQSSKERLEKIDVKNVVLSKRGIDQDVFKLSMGNDVDPYLQYKWYKENPLPILLYLGRVSPEKNIEAFIEGNCNGYHRVVVGDGPDIDRLKKLVEGKDIHFLGSVELGKTAPYYQHARIFCFTSMADAFGNTMVESCACGTPVISYRCPGPEDVMKEGIMGVMVDPNKSVFEGLEEALKIDRKECSEYTRTQYSWSKATDELLENLDKVEWKNNE